MSIPSKFLNRLPIYAKVGVPEAWHSDQQVLENYQRKEGK